MNAATCMSLIVCFVILAQADWKSEANGRIESYRKGDVILQLKTTSGQPAKSARITVEQLVHDYAFGTSTGVGDNQYWQHVKANFNLVVPENALKWKSTEPTRDQYSASTAKSILSQATNAGVAMNRGHTLFWGRYENGVGANYDPSFVRSLSSKDLLDEMREHVKDIVTDFKGKITEWDLNNEMITNNPPLAPQYTPEDYYTKMFGVGLVDSIFKWVGAIDPTIRLAFNEYGCEGEKNKAPTYYNMVKLFQGRGLKIGSIGLQAHMSDDASQGETIDQAVFLSRIHSLAPLGVPIKLTELDYDNSDQYKRADGLEIIIRTAFSHPSTNGIVLWGFREGAMWRKTGYLWRSDYTPVEPGKRYRQMVYNEWWTNTNKLTDGNGNASFRVFFGKHRITVEYGGQTSTFTLSYPRGADPKLDKTAGNGCTLAIGGNTATIWMPDAASRFNFRVNQTDQSVLLSIPANRRSGAGLITLNGAQAYVTSPQKSMRATGVFLSRQNYTVRTFTPRPDK